MSLLKTILALKFVLIQDWKLMLRHKTEEVHQKDKVGILRPKIWQETEKGNLEKGNLEKRQSWKKVICYWGILSFPQSCSSSAASCIVNVNPAVMVSSQLLPPTMEIKIFFPSSSQVLNCTDNQTECQLQWLHWRQKYQHILVSWLLLWICVTHSPCDS